MTTLVIHPGSPKTATSTLQRLLAAQRRKLALRSVGLILPENIRGKEVLGHYLEAYRGGDSAAWTEAAPGFFAEAATKERVICTEETFCHDFMPSRRYGHGGIDRAEVAAELLSRCGGFDRVEIVLTIRPQFDLLVSTYTHFVHRHREHRNFRDWLAAEVEPESMMWRPVVAAFRSRFGAGNVRVVSLATAREDGMEGYVRDVLVAFGLDPAGLKLTAEKVHNPSPSQRAVELCRLMNGEIKMPRKSEQVNSFLVQTFPVEEFGKFRPAWKPDAALAALWEADHAAALAASA